MQEAGPATQHHQDIPGQATSQERRAHGSAGAVRCALRLRPHGGLPSCGRLSCSSSSYSSRAQWTPAPPNRASSPRPPRSPRLATTCWPSVSLCWSRRTCESRRTARAWLRLDSQGSTSLPLSPAALSRRSTPTLSALAGSLQRPSCAGAVTRSAPGESWCSM